ncbi:aldehyde dehydrogenase family protein [Modestobacter versicolor]|uniref:Aldehyde dehydrogenase n=1 Tax=Modestobacter versicolor TaxID=429133 RepID=A0A323VGH9_9ACTN|nr:aldehyde dehydrogenase family protein [Modestobacter versicolor]MBB3674546.1 aldehyde dehydrogenase [Modestobacter versicolor]PZA23133.1 aldehyde dehydrogenase [Modestobacter versicolor]
MEQTPAGTVLTAPDDAVPHEAAVLVAGQRLASDFQPVVNPARLSEVIGRVALGTAEHVDQAVAAAAAAFPAWSQLSPHERAARLGDAAAAITAAAGPLAELLTREQGKVLWESRVDVGGAAHILGYYTGLADRLAEDEVFRSDARGTIWSGRRPMGVTGVIVPWNSPVYLAFLGIAPALLAGNTVVVKPSELAPLTLSAVLRVLADALPEGVVGVVPGGGEAGAAIAAHHGIRKVFFTGSTATGQQVMRAAAGNLKNISLELGGNDPAIVLESAVVDDRLVDELVQSVFTASGQICFNVKRIYVHRSHHDEFVERYTAAVDRLVVGDGLDPRSTMGPVNNRPQFERVKGLLERTRAAGATVTTLGRRLDPDTWDDGYFLQPTVVTDVEPGAELVTCEQFGPVVPVLPFDTDDEAVALANDSEFGLAASVWSQDREHALRVARRLECGSVFLNVHRIGASDVSMPFGGFKGSGIGRGHGITALEACTELQTIADHVDVSGFPGPNR